VQASPLVHTQQSAKVDPT